MPEDTPSPAADHGRLLPPKGGAVVRMYRIGHGDCFLLAFPGETEAKPVYVLIDCGYKPGSSKEEYINAKTSAKEVTSDIRKATGGHIDVAVITHEHQDHVNAITAKNFEGITIGHTWLAWTEDPTNSLANDLRVLYKDKLLGLMAARNRLAADGDDKRAKKIDNFLAFELGGDTEEFDLPAARTMLGAAPKDPLKSLNKQAMKLFKDRAQNGVKFLVPHGEIHALPGTSNIRVFALGPPQNLKALEDLDPVGKEQFHGLAVNVASPGNYFAAAAAAAENLGAAAPDPAAAGGGAAGNLPPVERRDVPFAKRYRVDWLSALSPQHGSGFFRDHYGSKDGELWWETDPYETREAASAPLKPAQAENAEWRRIDNEWLHSADQLALAMNNDTNNASLVLAFELGKGGKVLLFAGDAQRGNWLSWGKGTWKDGDKEITAKELLGRAVLYKAGHHCSHNATLNGLATDDYPNLGWMAAGPYAGEFTAMITAVRKWAETQDGWDHPRKEIKDALIKKAAGRVLQTDTSVDTMTKPDGTTAAEWESFTKVRTTGKDLYFDYRIDG